ncbi:MAG: Do family serine endopeptidase [Bdellovibrionales bacterium]
MIFKTLTKVCCILLALITSEASAQDRIAPESQAQMQLSFAPVVKQVSPAVVNIYTKRTVTRSVSPFMNDPFFSQFFGRNPFGQRMRKQAESSLGSGVIIAPNGLIATNAHVIRGAEEITVVLSDGRELDAMLALSDEASDIALLRVKNDRPLPSVSLKPSESLEVGDIVLAIGNPFGVGQTVTSGIVSAQGRSSLNINDFNFFIQTDAAINPGNSGGPLVALDGSVVGINTAIYSRDGGSLGIGFAVPSEMLASIVAAEKTGATNDNGIIRPWLGVSAQSITSDIGESLSLDAPRGAIISDLHKSSPLKKAGIKVGDVVTRVNGRDIRDPAEMKFRMATVPLGEKAEIIIARQGENIRFEVAAMAPPEDPPREETLLKERHILNGATIANLNPAVAVEFGIASEDIQAVIVKSAPPGTTASRVVGAGDLILEINGKEIEDVKDVQRALKRDNTRGISLTINSGGRIKQINVR